MSLDISLRTILVVYLIDKVRVTVQASSGFLARDSDADAELQ